MKPNSTAAWLELFPAAANAPLTTVRLRVLRRGDEPFFYLPTHNRTAAKALDLYPAQTWKARLAKQLLQVVFRCNPLPSGSGAPFLLPAKNNFLAWLTKTAELSEGTIPEFAVLAGNPNAPGRRFVFLLFDAAGNPVAVVKAGSSPRAQELIRHEASLLSEFGGKRAAIPALRNEAECGNVVAFSTEFIAGMSPAGEAAGPLESIFTTWLDETREAALSELPAWQNLEQTHRESPLPETLRALGQARVRPALMHGDFAPWNVKVANGRWTVLDWERGDRAGVPGWDWLHFVLQPAVLVQREPLDQTLARSERLFVSAEFIRYARRARIIGHEWLLTAAYVSFSLRVTRQTEGAARLGPLLEAIQNRGAIKK